jgi:hypothetical protein
LKISEPKLTKELNIDSSSTSDGEESDLWKLKVIQFLEVIMNRRRNENILSYYSTQKFQISIYQKEDKDIYLIY